MRWRLTPILFTLALMTAPSGMAGATSMHPFSLDEMIYVADHVVVGEVVSVESRFARDGRAIYTYVEVAVGERLKGSGGDTVTVWLLGGEVGDVGMAVEGTPAFDSGEQVLLFLEEMVHGLSVLGWAQGKFALLYDSDRGEPVAERPVGYDAELFGGFAGEAPTLAELRGTVLQRVAADHVPAYREIPGLPASKRAAFRTHHGLPQEVTR